MGPKRNGEKKSLLSEPGTSKGSERVKPGPSTARDNEDVPVTVQPSSSQTPSVPDDPGLKSTGSPSPGEREPLLPYKHSPFLRQIFLGVIIALPSIPPGMSLGYSAVSIPQLRLRVSAASWYASVTIMAFPIGCLMVGPLMDKWGRRPALLSINLLSFLGWLILAVPSTTPTIETLIIGRIITGIAGGLASVPAAVYAGECLVSTKITFRSALVSWSTVALCGGIFLVYLLGAWLPYYGVASVATLISVVSFILIAAFIPESPSWLVHKGRTGDAEWSKIQLGIDPPPPVTEQTSASEAEDNSPTPFINLPPTFNFRSPETYKPLLIMTAFFFFQQFSGVFVIIAYMTDIARAAGVIVVSPYTFAVIGGAVILTVSVLASMVYPSTGVRAVAVLSGVGSAATLGLIGIFQSLRLHFVSHGMWITLHWIPFFLLLANVSVSTVGFLILPWSMLGEVFPLNVRGQAAGIATCLGFLFGFIAAKSYPSIQQSIGISGIFFFFAAMAALGTLFVIKYLPETRGRTLQQIVDSFSKPRNQPPEPQAAPAPPPEPTASA